jgi:1-acyl-sn-glycerol-3-phosphate acyltransferase
VPDIAQTEARSQESVGGVRHFLSRLRSYLILDPLIWLYTVILGTISLLSSLFDHSGEIQHRIAQLWARVILWTIGADVQVEGLERIDTSRPQVYVVNHLSALDIPVLYGHLPFQFRILAKRELFHYPFMGWHLRRSGQIPVALENPKAAVRSLNLAVAALKHKMSMVIFPEGGRSPDGQLQAFMGGAFYAAIKSHADIVPMALVGTYEMLKMNTWHIKNCPLHLVVGEPIHTTGMTMRDVEKVTEQARQAIGDLYYARCMVPDLRGENLVTNEPKK